MKILVTGGCGFVGSNVALYLNKNIKDVKIYSLDNLSRKGSKFNLTLLKKNNINNYKIDISNNKKFSKLKKFDLIIDCCAEASVEASRLSIDRVINTNLIGTLNILKKVQQDSSKLIFISTSRVYPIDKINDLLKSKNFKNELKIKDMIDEKFTISGPKTIYGVSKLSSEMLIEEFAYAFGIKYISYSSAKALPGDLRSKTLIIDDISDTGETLADTEKLGFITATLSIRVGTKTLPHFYGELINDDRWLVFPWEKLNSIPMQDYLVDTK